MSRSRVPVVPEPLSPIRHAVEVRLFGRFRIQCGGYPMAGLAGGKSQELLAYLLVHRDRAHRREAVANLLWGETRSGDLRKTMRQALWLVHSALGPAAPLVECLDGDWLRVRPSSDLWLDLEAFETVWRELETVAGTQLSAAACERARDLLDECRGELLEGAPWEWCRFERERLHDLFVALVDKLMAWCEATGAHATGVRLGNDLLRADAARERTHRQLMRLHAAAGDRTGALRQYRRCVEALRDELAVAPSQATRDLYAQVRDGERPTEEPLRPDRAPGRDGHRDAAETRGLYKWAQTGLPRSVTTPGRPSP